MTWECVTFPQRVAYADGMGRLLGCFLREFFASGGSPEMGLFKARRKPPGVGEIIYLTPLAAERCREVTKDFERASCEPPPRAEVALVAGHMSARDLLSA